MKQFNNIMLLFLFGLAALAQTAQAVDKADVTNFSARLALSPYAQAVPNDSYTFIGVSHPSLDSAVTQIGVAVEVIDMTTTVNTPSGRAAVFTVDAGETHRVFVVNQGHSTINTSNDAFTDARTHIIPTVNSAQFGSIRVTSVSVRPELSIYEGTDVDGNKGRRIDTKPSTGEVYKYDDVSQLSIWGIVYTQASGTGFAMEFIGDMHDSSLGGEQATAIPSKMNGCNVSQSGRGCKGIAAGTNDRARPGRGIN